MPAEKLKFRLQTLQASSGYDSNPYSVFRLFARNFQFSSRQGIVAGLWQNHLLPPDLLVSLSVPGRTLPRLSSCRRTTRAGHHLVVSFASETHSGVLVLMEAKPFASSGPPCFTQCARQDSNLQPFGSKPNALSFELRAHNYLFVVF